MTLQRFEVDAVVAGAGIVGLAVARALALAGRDVVILEGANAIGTGVSARNSEVIHAGIYYDPGSLKARLCVAGKWALYDYLKTHSIAHRKIGKLIVANGPRESAQLDEIAKRAFGNGVDDLRALDAKALAKLEPDLCADEGLFSPSTGIVDSHGLMLSLLGEAEDHGARLALNTPVLRGQALSDGRTRLICGGPEPSELIAKSFVNAAGLSAVSLASDMAGFPGARLPGLRFAKGSYFSLRGTAPFARLIYPVPQEGGLGVHLTLDLAGQARFGPDVEWLEAHTPDEIDYRVDTARGEAFYAAIRTYWPGLKAGALAPDYAGVRPKLTGRDQQRADFQICAQTEHGLAGQVHLFGVESPGLTAALALADEVCFKL